MKGFVKEISFKSGVKGRRSDRWWERRWWLWWGDMHRIRWTRRRVNTMRSREWRRELIQWQAKTNQNDSLTLVYLLLTTEDRQVKLQRQIQINHVKPSRTIGSACWSACNVDRWRCVPSRWRRSLACRTASTETQHRHGRTMDTQWCDVVSSSEPGLRANWR